MENIHYRTGFGLGGLQVEQRPDFMGEPQRGHFILARRCCG